MKAIICKALDEHRLAYKVLDQNLQALLDSGNWMIRVDQNGVGYDGFRWKPIGEWTECPKWTSESEENPTCENGGLFGQSPAAGGYCNKGTTLCLCETEGPQIPVGGDKIKVRRAKRVAEGTTIPAEFFAAIPNLLLYLSGCDLTGLTLPQSVGGSLDLSGCDLTGLTLPQSVGGSLYLSGCDRAGITLPQSVGGSLYLSGNRMQTHKKGAKP